MTVEQLATLPVGAEQDVVAARQRARDIARVLGFEPQDQARVATAVSEIARNAQRYARGGRCEFAVEGERLPHALVVRITDAGPGIPHLADVLAGRYRSATGMGLGLVGAQRLVDHFDIRSDARGTEVVLRKALPARAAALSPAELRALAAALARQTPITPYEALSQQHQELLRALGEVEERQQELVRLNRELEDTNRGVVALYAELDEKAEHLRRADETKTRFLSSVSHEFRTPLNSIRALSGLLLDRVDGPLTAEQETQVGYVRKAAEDLSNLVEDLLDIAKIESGKIEVHAGEVSVPTLFSALRGMLRPLLVSESVRLRFDADDDLPLIWTDEAKLAQVLRNFISNALKFTERGEVRVSAAQVHDGVRFAVSDTGIGIAQEHLDAIFEEFVQVPGALQRRVKGTGLGLALCKRLAHLLGGRVEVQSEPGVGSTFSLIVPLRYADASASHVPPVAAVVPELPAPQRSRVPILVIDDDPATRYAMRRLLDGASYDVLEAGDAVSGLAAARRAHPGLIVLDLGLPDRDGTQLLAELKTDAATRAIPVVIATSRDLSTLEEHSLRERAHAVLAKRELNDSVVAAVSAALAAAAGTGTRP